MLWALHPLHPDDDLYPTGNIPAHDREHSQVRLEAGLPQQCTLYEG